MNFGTTAAYCEVGSWRGPKTLKYRSTTVSRSYTRLKLTQNRSAASFDTAYGEIGSGFWSSLRGNEPLFPYTDDEEATTTRRTFSSRAASRTLSVPSTFTAAVVSGSCTDRGTEGSAPWWKTSSTPRVAACTRSYERSSPSTISSSFASSARFARLPVEKLSSTRTSSPRSTSARARLEPMKPPPPVTRTFTARRRRGSWRRGFQVRECGGVALP